LRTRLGVAGTEPFDLATAVAATGESTIEVEAVTLAPGQTQDVLDRLARTAALAESSADHAGAAARRAASPASSASSAAMIAGPVA
jgi:hypothetical protein